MTKTEIINCIADALYAYADIKNDDEMAKYILELIEVNRMSTHQQDEWEPEHEKK